MARSKLVSLKIRNFGCIGSEPVEIALDNIVCLVGKNNCGKTTILRAYECAQGSESLSEDDIFKNRPEGDLTEVELVVHIPDGIYNVDAKWKYDDDRYGMQLVRSRWQWRVAGEAPIRQTWDPEAQDWSTDGKAGGADNVFKSRLPQPLRIDSLQDAHKEHEELLKLITEPVASELKLLQSEAKSGLYKAIGKVVEEAFEPVLRYQKDIDDLSGQLDRGFKGIFPDLGISINVSLDRPSIDAAKLLAAGSSVKIKEGGSESFLRQQGTGSRRALFWSLLQVRNQLQRRRKLAGEKEKELGKTAEALAKEEAKAKPNKDKILEFQNKLKSLENTPAEEIAAFPGHILLIDEPENALHPMAARAARNHLYALSKDAGWQVMLTTHSPYFIDPLEDHTTIVRLERIGNQTCPKTYRTENINFSQEEKENLRALIQLDTSLAEMFFGSYPVIVEGDTETAAFIAAVVEPGELLSQQICLIPSRGKGLIEPLIKLVTHFGVSFGILHDTDAPKKSDGTANGMWSLNMKIEKAVAAARTKGLDVRHKLSVPNFENLLGIHESDKDKPILAYRSAKTGDTKQQVIKLFTELFQDIEHKPLSYIDGNYEAELTKKVTGWAASNRPGDAKFKAA